MRPAARSEYGERRKGPLRGRMEQCMRNALVPIETANLRIAIEYATTNNHQHPSNKKVTSFLSPGFLVESEEPKGAINVQARTICD